jgi:hypothetical protein
MVKCTRRVGKSDNYMVTGCKPTYILGLQKNSVLML